MHVELSCPRMIYTKCVGLNFCSGPDVYCCGSVAAASVVVYTCIGAAIDIAIYIKCAIFAGKEYGTIYGYIFSDVDLAVFAGITLFYGNGQVCTCSVYGAALLRTVYYC